MDDHSYKEGSRPRPFSSSHIQKTLKMESEWAHQSPPMVYQRRQRPPPTTTTQPFPDHPHPAPKSKSNTTDPLPPWKRALSIRGRISIAAGAARFEDRPPPPKRKGRPPPPPRGKPNFDRERRYFEEVDAFELEEESPSPKPHLAAWSSALPDPPPIPLPYVSSRLERWLFSKYIASNTHHAPSSTLSKILDTCPVPADLGYIPEEITTPVKPALGRNLSFHSVNTRISNYLLSCRTASRVSLLGLKEGIEDAVRKLSLASTSSLLDYADPFASLLAVCEQSAPSTLLDVLSTYCDPESIVKVGEGTYGEAFVAGNTVCKIVPFDGDLRVNGEVQKKSEELLEEVVLSKTLNHLRELDGDSHNACTIFIETLDLKVCQGPYDQALIRAWEDWDEKNGSENDHPKGFPEKQRYVVFVLKHGGKDLESFVLNNFREARSLLVQVTAGLAVAEAAFEFEHRDLHWGNILLSRNENAEVQFTLEGKKMSVESHGLVISIIDFTLSRINTGDDILFLDLSSDPYLFKGPKGDKQAETYRKMKDITQDCWEGSFPKTNVLWLQYVVDILLVKKSFERCSKDERELRSLKKRLDKYESAKEAISDSFFSGLLSN